MEWWSSCLMHCGMECDLMVVSTFACSGLIMYGTMDYVNHMAWLLNYMCNCDMYHCSTLWYVSLFHCLCIIIISVHWYKLTKREKWVIINMSTSYFSNQIRKAPSLKPNYKWDHSDPPTKHVARIIPFLIWGWSHLIPPCSATNAPYMLASKLNPICTLYYKTEKNKGFFTLFS